MDNYPGNSRTGKEEPVEPKKIEKVITGEVVRRKKPLGKRFMETFVGGSDSKSVWEYVLYDVLVPAAKDTVSDAVSQGIERMLFGDVRSRSSARSRASSSYTAYNRYTSPSHLSRREEPKRDISRRGRSIHNFDEIILPTRREAEEIIDAMLENLKDYEEVTVAQLYEMLGIRAEFTDQRYGWTDIRGVGATKVRDGYLLDLPKPEPLD